MEMVLFLTAGVIEPSLRRRGQRNLFSTVCSWASVSARAMRISRALRRRSAWTGSSSAMMVVVVVVEFRCSLLRIMTSKLYYIQFQHFQTIDKQNSSTKSCSRTQ